ncbi:MAG: FapA family protein [Proteobacteria bacterium]|nr:FapA family protein [Pseudomonadota bacterium]MBU0968392.1 FapA family protein [Pseudomonadota bacterium]
MDLSKKPVKICNDHFLLKLTKDKLKAVLQLVSEEDRFENVPFDELVKEVQAQGVSFGFVAKLPPAREGKTVIASGKPPVPGENAKVKPVVKPVIVSRAKSLKPGKDRVDFRELGNIVNVPKGQLLLKKIPATLGTPGKNVLGEAITCKPGKDVNIKCGPGVALSEDGLQVTALVDGKFVMGDGKPAVYEEHVITGNVDMAVGNIAFCGTKLEITGEVLPGFKIKCKGDVFIGKGVNNVQILAGGTVRISGGVVGQDAEIRAKGDIQLDFCENFGLIETRGSLRVENFVVQGRVKTGGNITVVGGKGTVIGGKYVIGGSMHVKELGSEAEVVTEVTVGLKPELEKKKRQVEAAKEYWPSRMNEILKNISALNDMKKAEGKDFGGEKANVLAELNKMMPEVMEKNNQLTEMQMQLDKELEQSSSEAIYVYGCLCPGVSVTIGKAVRVIDKQERQVVVELNKSTLQIHVRSMTAEEKEVVA